MEDLPSVDELKQLPLRAIVAYAVRCAARVQASDQEQHSSYDPHHELAQAREFCLTGTWDTELSYAGGRRGPPFPQHVECALAAQTSAVKAVVGEPRNCAAYAVDAAEAAMASLLQHAERAPFVGGFRRECRRDFARLVDLRLGVFPKHGRRVVPDADGPLGSLWTHDPPPGLSSPYRFATYSSARSEDEALMERSLISVCFDDDAEITKEEMLLVVKYLSEAYRDLGGHGLVVVDGYSHAALM